MITPPELVKATIDTLHKPANAYIYDLTTLKTNITTLNNALPPHTQLLYAMKANPHPDIVATAATNCHGIEVASQGELTTALTAGAHHITFSGPAKTDTALTTALTAGATINVESTHELHRLNQIAQQHHTTATTALRVNRNTPPPGGTHHMTGTPTPFGIDETQLPQALALAAALPGIQLTGLHLHAVSNNLDAAAHAAFVNDCVAFSANVAAAHELPLETINVGGGFGVDLTGEGNFDLAEFAGRIHPAADVTLVFEIGRFLVADIGWYVCEVLDIKRNHGRNFAVVRGGTHQFRLPAAWGYSHPAMVHPVDQWPYPWDRTELTNTTVDVVGELCTPRDVLSRDLPVDRLRIGDVLVLPRTGAYGWTVSHHDFLSHQHPQVIVLDD